MTAAVHGTGVTSLAVPLSQNTAPVFEFNCLYTHDIRRKQKRWQDGFLRFHTFNKRVMVYDIPRNFIGDTYWTADGELQDGDEVTLDREGVMVQVAESVGRTHTDLTELRRGRKKGSSEKGSSSPLRAPQTPALPSQLRTGATEVTQLKHRSLNALLGPPKGLIGKATLPTKSPFEQQRTEIENEDWTLGRPPKRRRTDEPPAGGMRTTTTALQPATEAQISNLISFSNSINRKQKIPQNAPRPKSSTKEIVDLCSDSTEGKKTSGELSGDVLEALSSPSRIRNGSKVHAAVRSSSAAFQRQETPKNASRRQWKDDAEQVVGAPQNKDESQVLRGRHISSRPSDNSHRGKNLQERRGPESTTAQSRQAEVLLRGSTDSINDQTASGQSVRRTDKTSGKTLRMIARVPKKRTLLCLNQLSKENDDSRSINIGHLITDALEAARADRHTQVRERLAKIEHRDRARSRDASDGPHDNVGNTLCLRTELPVGQKASDTPLTADAGVLGQLGQAATRTGEEDFVEPIPPSLPMPSPRHLRRVVSESSKVATKGSRRTPGAPAGSKKDSPLPKTKHPSLQSNTSRISTSAIQLKPRTKKTVQRAVSLNTGSSGTSTVILSRPFQAPKPPDTKAALPGKAADPWSREAFDLFSWRPPGWDEETWCLASVDASPERDA